MSFSNIVSEIKQVSLRDQVLAAIQKLIIAGEIRPGGRVVEDQLRKSLGVSRTPVREALILLERDGLVEMHLNKGCFVRTFEPQEIRDIFVFRTALENLAAELAVPKMTDDDFDHMDLLIKRQLRCIEDGDVAHGGEYDLEFHTYPIEMTGNGLLQSAWQTTAVNYTVLLTYRGQEEDGDMPRPIREHRELLAKMRAYDVAAVKSYQAEINQWAAERCVEGLLAASQHKEE